MIKLAEQNLCTGCGACAFKCPRNCISMQEDIVGQIYPIIDTTRCVECHVCEKTCPILNEPVLHKSQKAYAAWSNNLEERRTSASGGIAIEMYKKAVSDGWLAIGAVQNSDFSVTHKITANIAELSAFKNSKYVFSDAYEVFSKIKKAIAQEQKIIFIGLPCQVAALRKLFRDDNNLLLVEVICHGTTPYSYLKQHVDMLSMQAGKTAVRMSFRDPAAFTYTYTFTLYDEKGKMFYAKRTKDGDTYQFGYHRAVTYRENCYNCNFARSERNADITIADYHGLGLVEPCSFTHEKVSLILENSDRGSSFVENLITCGFIHAEQRPINEPFLGESQLRHPTSKNKYRLIFEDNIKKTRGNFEISIQKSLKKYNRDRITWAILSFPKKVARKVIRKILG